jgi:hypothetical protein
MGRSVLANPATYVEYTMVRGTTRHKQDPRQGIHLLLEKMTRQRFWLAIAVIVWRDVKALIR